MKHGGENTFDDGAVNRSFRASASVREASSFLGMSVKIAVEDDFSVLIDAEMREELVEVGDGRCSDREGLGVEHSVEIVSVEIASVVAVNHAVGIQHGDDFPDGALAEGLRDGIHGIEKEIDQAFDREGGHRLAGMNTSGDDANWSGRHLCR